MFLAVFFYFFGGLSALLWRLWFTAYKTVVRNNFLDKRTILFAPDNAI